jgi:hypothetical protein
MKRACATGLIVVLAGFALPAAGNAQVPSLRAPSAVSAGDAVLALQEKLAALRLRFTEQHPDVQAVIASINRQRPEALRVAREALANLRLRYTEQHPDVQRQLAHIRMLEQ